MQTLLPLLPMKSRIYFSNFCHNNIVVPSLLTIIGVAIPETDLFVLHNTCSCQLIFLNPVLFAVCTSTLSKLCKRHLQWHVKECSVALLCNNRSEASCGFWE
jgi:hypothetical protein